MGLESAIVAAVVPKSPKEPFDADTCLGGEKETNGAGSGALWNGLGADCGGWNPEKASSGCDCCGKEANPFDWSDANPEVLDTADWGVNVTKALVLEAG